MQRNYITQDKQIQATHKTLLLSQTGSKSQMSSRFAVRPTDAGAHSKSQWIRQWHRLFLYTRVNGAARSDKTEGLTVHIDQAPLSICDSLTGRWFWCRPVLSAQQYALNLGYRHWGLVWNEYWLAFYFKNNLLIFKPPALLIFIHRCCCD